MTPAVHQLSGQEPGADRPSGPVVGTVNRWQLTDSARQEHGRPASAVAGCPRGCQQRGPFLG
jgi:hypothetical protein